MYYQTQMLLIIVILLLLLYRALYCRPVKKSKFGYIRMISVELGILCEYSRPLYELVNAIGALQMMTTHRTLELPKELQVFNSQGHSFLYFNKILTTRLVNILN